MIYISLDIETTGLNPLENDVLEVGAYIENTRVRLPREKLPFFHCYVWKENYRGDAYALAMNVRIFQKILELKKNNDPLLMEPGDVSYNFGQWLLAHKDLWPREKFINQCGPFNIAGKNLAGFDLPFLNQLPGWNSVKFHRRVLDPAFLYYQPGEDDVLPDLSLCKKRAGLGENVTHETLDDSWDTIQLIRRKT